MSHPHPPSDTAGGQPPGQYPAYSAPYLGTYTPPATQRANWPLILVAVALAVALAGVVLKATLHTGPDAPPPSASALPPAPPMVVPQGSIPATGPGWIMRVSPDWDGFSTPAKLEVDSAWATGGGVRGFANNIAVQHETQPATATLQGYVTTFVAQLPQQSPKARVLSQQAYEAPGHEYGRVAYTMTEGDLSLQSVAYLTKTADGFAIATFTAPRQLFAKSAPMAEPFLASLKAH